MNRRDFLTMCTGFAASIGLASLMPIDILAIPETKSLPSPNRGERWLVCIMVQPSGKTPSNRPITFSLCRKDSVIQKMFINPQATYQWMSCPGYEIIFPDYTRPSVAVDDPRAQSCLIYQDGMDIYEGIRLVKSYSLTPRS